MTAIPETLPPVVHVVDAADDITALDLEGEFDIAAAPDVLAHADRAIGAGKHLIVNLSDVTFLDSSTIHALFTAAARAREAGRAFVLQFGTHATVKRVLALTRADEILPRARTREEAIALIRG